MANLVQSIKLAAVEAVEASKPCMAVYGTVRSTSPLSVSIDQKLLLDEELLVLTKNVKDYQTEAVVEQETPEGIKTMKYKCTVHNALKAGERVVLLRMQGGQKFIVMDRVV